MRGFIIGLSISVAFILGAVFAVTQITPAFAAQDKQFTECMGVITWFGRGRDVNAGRLPKKRLRVPAGWTPIGGGGPSDDGVEPYIILCK